MQEVQFGLYFGFGIALSFASSLYGAGALRTSSTSLVLKSWKLARLSKLKKSARSSTRICSRFGTRNVRVTETSARANGSVLPALRATLPLYFLKSTIVPLGSKILMG